MNTPFRYADMQTEERHFPPYSLPDDIMPDPNATKFAFPMQACDRPRAEYEILQCGDLLFAAQRQTRGLSVPRLYTGDIVFGADEPNVVYDTVSDSVSELHFTLCPEGCRMRGILYYRDNSPYRCIMEISQTKYLYSVIAQKTVTGNYEIEKIGRTVQKQPSSEKARQIIPAIFLIFAVCAIAASLLFAYLQSRSVSTSVDADTAPVQTSASDEPVLLSLTDPVCPGENIRIIFSGKPNTPYSLTLLYENGQDTAGSETVFSDEHGKVTWERKLPSSTEPGICRIRITGEHCSQIYSFHVAER